MVTLAPCNKVLVYFPCKNSILGFSALSPASSILPSLLVPVEQKFERDRALILDRRLREVFSPTTASVASKREKPSESKIPTTDAQAKQANTAPCVWRLRCAFNVDFRVDAVTWGEKSTFFFVVFFFFFFSLLIPEYTRIVDASVMAAIALLDVHAWCDIRLPHIRRAPPYLHVSSEEENVDLYGPMGRSAIK